MSQYSLPSGPATYERGRHPALSLLLLLGIFAAAGFWFLQREPNEPLAPKKTEHQDQVDADTEQIDHIAVHVRRVEQELAAMTETTKQMHSRLQQLGVALGDDVSDYEKRRLLAAKQNCESLTSAEQRATEEIHVLQKQLLKFTNGESQ